MSRLSAINLLRERIVEIRGAASRVAERSAPLIQAQLRADAKTKRGNIPSYGEKGNVPIVANATDSSVVITAPDWVLKIAQERGQIDKWREIVQEVASAELAGAK